MFNFPPLDGFVLILDGTCFDDFSDTFDDIVVDTL
jgi:hypothetical protein